MLSIPDNVVDIEAIENGDASAQADAIRVLKDSLNGLLARPLMGKWEGYTPVWSSLSGGTGSIGNGTLAGQYAVVGNIVFFSVYFVRGSTTSAPHASAGWTFTIPAKLQGAIFCAGYLLDGSTSRALVGRMHDLATGEFTVHGTGGSDAEIGETAITWNSGDLIYVSGFGEIAE